MTAHSSSSSFSSAAARAGSSRLPFEHDATLWRTDGNVILLPSNRAVGFCVNQKVLLEQSPRWSEVLKPRAGGQRYEDNVPVYELDDTEDDLRVALKHLHQSNPISATPRLAGWTSTYAALGPILRLATKYEMTELRKEVILVLEADWPTTLQGWDANEGEMHQRIAGYWQSWNGRTTSTLVGTELDAIGPEPATIVALAIECNVPSILPAAFYHLNRVYQNPKPHKSLLAPGPQNRTFVPHILPARALHALLLGRESLARFASEARFNESDFEQDGCCTGARTWWRDIGVRKVCEGPWRLDPLQALDKLAKEMEENKEPKNACQKCHAQMKASLAALRKELWNRLPRWFRVDAA